MLKTSATDVMPEKKIKVKSKSKFKLTANDKYYAYIFAGPSLFLLGLFVFYPMFRTLYISLFLTNTFGNTTLFVGLENYVKLISSPDFVSSMWVTLVYVVGVTFFTIAMGLLLANLASQKLPGIAIFRTLYSVTMGVSVSVSVAAIF